MPTLGHLDPALRHPIEGKKRVHLGPDATFQMNMFILGPLDVCWANVRISLGAKNCAGGKKNNRVISVTFLLKTSRGMF